MSGEKRYVTTLELNVYASSDEEAIAKSKEIAGSLSRSDDNHCEVTGLSEYPFASLEARRVILKS